MRKKFMLAASGLLSLGLAGFMPAPSPGAPDDPPPPHKKKDEPAKKGEPGPAGDLRLAHDLPRRIKSNDGLSGRLDERLRDCTKRSAKFDRKAVPAHATADPRFAHKYPTPAHDPARAVDHARNASRFDRAEDDRPPPLPPYE